MIQILYGKSFTRESSSDSNVSGYEDPTNFSGFKVSGHGTKPRRFTVGFVAACVNGNMNPDLKHSSFVMNPKPFALV